MWRARCGTARTPGSTSTPTRTGPAGSIITCTPTRSPAATTTQHTTTQADNAAAGATGGTGRGPSVDFTEEQMAGIRKALGKKDGEEISPAEVTEAMAKLATTPRIDASAPETPVVSDGTYLVDSSIIEDWRNRALQGDAAVHELSIRERDSIMAAAVLDGKFPQSRLEHYQKRWDTDPEGTRREVETLASGLVPMVGPIGSNPGWDPDLPGDFDSQAAYNRLYPDEAAPAAGNRR